MEYKFLVVSAGNRTIPMRLGLGFASSNLLRVLGKQDLNHKPIQFSGTILLFLICILIQCTAGSITATSKRKVEM